jgi:hypothetical protein
LRLFFASDAPFHQCDATAPHKNYTKLSFAERMLELSGRAQGRGEPAAQASLELANGFYNMSFYGNGRDIYSTRGSNLSPRWENATTLSPALRMDLAHKYYLQAAALSSNSEFKAKATFMAAKVEQAESNDRTHFQSCGSLIRIRPTIRKLSESAATSVRISACRMTRCNRIRS